MIRTDNKKWCKIGAIQAGISEEKKVFWRKKRGFWVLPLSNPIRLFSSWWKETPFLQQAFRLFGHRTITHWEKAKNSSIVNGALFFGGCPIKKPSSIYIYLAPLPPTHWYLFMSVRATKNMIMTPKGLEMETVFAGKDLTIGFFLCLSFICGFLSLSLSLSLSLMHMQGGFFPSLNSL